jgi:hypothetical protein
LPVVFLQSRQAEILEMGDQMLLRKMLLYRKKPTLIVLMGIRVIKVRSFMFLGHKPQKDPFNTLMVQQPEGDKGKSDKIEFESEGFFRTRYDAIQSAAQKAVHHYNTWCKSGPHPPTYNMSRHDLSNFSELSSLIACGKCKCNKDMAGDDIGQQQIRVVSMSLLWRIMLVRIHLVDQW